VANRSTGARLRGIMFIPVAIIPANIELLKFPVILGLLNVPIARKQF
jgi:hypothetical protein